METKWSAPTTRPTIRSSNYMVSAGHYLAALAATRILDAGGNAVDAGVAGGLCLNVVQPDLTSMGGVAPIVVRDATTGDVSSLSGLGQWPESARPEYFVENHDGQIPPGVMRSVVPSAIGAWLTALEHFGSMSFTEVAAPARELADNGFPVTTVMNDTLSEESTLTTISQWPTTAQIFLDSTGQPLAVGERQRQPDLARLIDRLSTAEADAADRRSGIRAVYDAFYRGRIAEEIVGFNQKIGGWLSMKDMATFTVDIERAPGINYRGYEIFGCGPWCQGPVVLEVMNILEGYDFTTIPAESSQFFHLIIEALKAGFADRDRYYGDPRFIDVPLAGLLSKEYAAQWRDRISTAYARPAMPTPGDAWQFDPGSDPGSGWEFPAPTAGLDEPDTSYICVVDSDGNAFSATPSDGIMGAPIIEGLGIITSGRGGQSWLTPGHPSVLAGGKRPRLTPNPGLVVKPGELIMPYGTPGLDMQPQAMVQFLIRFIDHGMDLQAAIEQPRVGTYSFPASSTPHPYRPGLVKAESRIDQTTLAELEALGHRIEAWPEWSGVAGSISAIAADPVRGDFAGGADPRRVAYALGW